jgi:hypothetical protein
MPRTAAMDVFHDSLDDVAKTLLTPTRVFAANKGLNVPPDRFGVSNCNVRCLVSQ